MPLYASILIGAATTVVLLAAFVATRPSDYRVSRSTVVAAPPSAVFGLVNDYRQWDGWSPWAKLDPAMTVTYDGPPVGVGASYAWAGKKVGAGQMTTTEAVSDSLLRIRLEFFRPMAGVCPTEFTFARDGGGTRVTWTMTGRNGFVGKLFFALLGIAGKIGTDFEKGLASMKAMAEAGTPSRAAA